MSPTFRDLTKKEKKRYVTPENYEVILRKMEFFDTSKLSQEYRKQSFYYINGNLTKNFKFEFHPDVFFIILKPKNRIIPVIEDEEVNIDPSNYEKSIGISDYRTTKSKIEEVYLPEYRYIVPIDEETQWGTELSYYDKEERTYSSLVGIFPARVSEVTRITYEFRPDKLLKKACEATAKNTGFIEEEVAESIMKRQFQGGV